LLVIPLLCLGAVIVYNIPFVHERLAWRVDNLRVRIQYALNPPEQVVFVPEEAVDAIVNATLTALAPTATTTPTPTPTATRQGPTETPMPTVTPTLSPTPLPLVVQLEGVQYEDQHGRWNFCGMANLSMALNYWDWDGDRDDVGRAVRSSDDDKNIMPYELQDFALSEGYGAIIRYGGEISLLQRLIVNGFPVMAEKGYDVDGVGWLGHYQFVTGYDENQQVLVVQDTYIDEGENHEFTYQEFITGWRAFNYLFMVVYPLDREMQLMALLGDWVDVDWAARHALAIAQKEVSTLTGIDQYFAAFNVGSSHVALREYVDAAYFYDFAFQLYAELADDEHRPYRIMWYQTGPYFAYYYSARYQDVVNLANVTFDTIADDVLEESWYWRGMGQLALGYTDNAITDFREAVRLHVGFAPAMFQLEQLGVSP